MQQQSWNLSAGEAVHDLPCVAALQFQHSIKNVGILTSASLLSDHSRHYLGSCPFDPITSSLFLTDMEATERLVRTWIASGREDEISQIASGMLVAEG